MDDRLASLCFSLFLGIGPVRFAHLVAAFGTANEAWTASVHDLQMQGMSEALAQKFESFRETFVPTNYVRALGEKGISFVAQSDENYPKRLRQIPNPPIVLYHKGAFAFNDSENNQTIAIVGSRRVTSYGKQVTEQFTNALVDAGFVIVSGLALGVDSIAHAQTLTSGGRTIAVLGCGVDVCYPRENLRLYEQIIKHKGVIVSEYPMGQGPTRGSFPARNRIISGLARGVLVTEGAADSGSLITAKEAYKQHRPVFAIPGPINSSLSQGPYELIKKGGTLATNAEEIIHELGITNYELGVRKKSITADTKEEQMIIDLLQQESLSFDELVRKTRIPAAKLGGILSLMEMNGKIDTTDVGIFRLSE